MTDLELTKLCAAALGWKFVAAGPFPDYGVRGWRAAHYEHEGKVKEWASVYDPLHDDAQCMALVKKCKLNIRWHYGENIVRAIYCGAIKEIASTYQADPNRAICECVAKMQAAK